MSKFKNFIFVIILKIMCAITRSLNAILDPNNPEDKKILLLAQLIEDMRDSIYKREDKIQKDIESLKSRVDDFSAVSATEQSLKADIAAIKIKVDNISKACEGCPIPKNTSGSKVIRFITEYPKVFIALILLIGLILGINGSDISQFIIKIISSL